MRMLDRRGISSCGESHSLHPIPRHRDSGQLSGGRLRIELGDRLLGELLYCGNAPLSLSPCRSPSG